MSTFEVYIHIKVIKVFSISYLLYYFFIFLSLREVFDFTKNEYFSTYFWEIKIKLTGYSRDATFEKYIEINLIHSKQTALLKQ